MIAGATKAVFRALARRVSEFRPVTNTQSLPLRISDTYTTLTMATSSSRSRNQGSPEKPSSDSSDSGESARSDVERFTPFYGKESPFSQHHMCGFTIDEIPYNCAEQYMMHQKAVLFRDDEMAKKILESKKPMEQKKFGRKVKNFDNAIWNTKCEDIVRRANMAKFSQNPDLKEALLNSKGTTLVEASPRDRKWGVGYGVKRPEVHNRKQWRGKNLLGQILTSVREEIESLEKLTKS